MTEFRWLINAGTNKAYNHNGTAHVLERDRTLCRQEIKVNVYPMRLGLRNNGVVAEVLTVENEVCPNCERELEAKGYVLKDGKWVQRFTAA